MPVPLWEAGTVGLIEKEIWISRLPQGVKFCYATGNASEENAPRRLKHLPIRTKARDSCRGLNLKTVITNTEKLCAY